MAPAFLLNSTLAAPYVDKQGQWLNSPQAVLYGISGSQYNNVLVYLDSPVYDGISKVWIFPAVGSPCCIMNALRFD